MPTPITGVPGASHTSPITFNGPADTESATAASVNAPLQALADVVSHLQADAALKAANNTFTGTNDFTGGVAEVATPTASAHAVRKDYVDPGLFVASGRVRGTDGVLLASKGSVAVTGTPFRLSTGNYQNIGIAGLTANSIIIVTPVGSGQLTPSISIASGHFNVTMFNVSLSQVDCDFSFVVIQL